MSSRGLFGLPLRTRASRLRWMVLGAIAGLQVSALNTVPALGQVAGNDWPEYLNNFAGSGFTNETLISPANAGSLAAKNGWPVKLTNGAVCPSSRDSCSNLIASQPVIASVAGTALVYVGSWNGSEYALCGEASCQVGGTIRTTGQVVWSTYLGRTSGCGGPFHSPLQGVTSAAAVGSAVIKGVTHNVVYVGGGGNITQSGGVLSTGTAQLFALDALSGAILWQTSLGSSPSRYMYSSPLLANGSVYMGVASENDCPLVQGQVVQLDPSTGQMLHVFNVVPNGCGGGGVWGSPVADTAGAVYVATGNPGSCREPYAEAVIKLSSTLGLLSYWRVRATEQIGDGDFGSTPTMFAGTVTRSGSLRPLLGVANKNGIYYVFDRNSISAGPVQRLQIAVGGKDPTAGDGSISPSSWDGSHLFVAGGKTTIKGIAYSGGLRAFDPNNMASPLWELGFSTGPVLGAVSTDPGLAVVGTGTLSTVVNTASGATVFSGSGSALYGAPSIAHGVVYEGDASGAVRAYSVNGQ